MNILININFQLRRKLDTILIIEEAVTAKVCVCVHACVHVCVHVCVCVCWGGGGGGVIAVAVKVSTAGAVL